MRPSYQVSPLWRACSHRAELLALYAEVDALLEGWACACAAPPPLSPRCCRFDQTGREPYPTRIEIEEVLHAMRAVPPVSRTSRHLPMAREARGPCPLLAPDGRCTIYASRPLGCRTFFCNGAEGPDGPRSKLPRAAIGEIGRRVADLSARFAPRDPHPRPLVRALVSFR